MSFILGLLVALGLSSKGSHLSGGGIQFMTMEEAIENMGKHQDPFDLQDAIQARPKRVIPAERGTGSNSANH